MFLPWTFVRRPLLLFVLLLLLVPATASPQAATAHEPAAPAPSSQVLKVFLDCVNAYCDEDFIRSEITFINFVRDRRDADVHALITAQGTGGGGREYTIALVGAGRFANIDHRLVYVSTNTDTNDTIRKGLARVLRLGLVHYAVDSALGTEIDVVHKRASQPQTPSKGAKDPWNAWVFRTSVRGSGSGEQSSRSSYVYGSLSANRVTEAWKINTSASGSYRRARYTFSEGDSYTSITRSFGTYGLVVKSLSQHWSAGGRASASSSTFLNQRLALRVAPAVEYNVYPYKESTRRQLTLNYSVGVNGYRYREETIFGKVREMRPDETLTVSWDLRQPWGSTSTAFEASHYLEDLHKHRLVLYSSVDIRLFKGFSLSGYGSVSRIRNQLYLPKGEATPEEILVRQRQLATSYQYYVSIGFSYSFGSIFNNVVNSRFNEGGGEYFY